MVNKKPSEIHKPQKPSITEIQVVFFARVSHQLIETAESLESAGLNEEAGNNRWMAALAEARVVEALKSFKPHILNIN